MTKKGKGLPYREGDWFAVPLRMGGYAVGLIARSGPRGKVLLGYFFGPRKKKQPLLGELGSYAPNDAILVGQFGDLALIRGTWPILGQAGSWDRQAWPMPSFGRLDEVDKRAWMVTYSEEHLNRVVAEEPCSMKEAQRLPKDVLMGSGAVEIRLTKLLSSQEVSHRTT